MSEPKTAEVTNIESVGDYVREYEFRSDGGDYTPNEGERILIEDAIHGWISRNEASGNPFPEDLVSRLLSSAKALRENTVYTGDGDPVRLLVQADEMAEAAAALRAHPASDQSDTERMRAALSENMDKLWIARCDSRDEKFRAAAERAVEMGKAALAEKAADK